MVITVAVRGLLYKNTCTALLCPDDWSWQTFKPYRNVTFPFEDNFEFLIIVMRPTISDSADYFPLNNSKFATMQQAWKDSYC